MMIVCFTEGVIETLLSLIFNFTLQLPLFISIFQNKGCSYHFSRVGLRARFTSRRSYFSAIAKAIVS